MDRVSGGRKLPLETYVPTQIHYQSGINNKPVLKYVEHTIFKARWEDLRRATHGKTTIKLGKRMAIGKKRSPEPLESLIDLIFFDTRCISARFWFKSIA